MGILTELFDDSSYQSNLEGHREEDLREALEGLENLTPESLGYWRLKFNIFRCVGRNGMEQYSRGKDGAGHITLRLFEKLEFELSKLEDEYEIQEDRF